MPDSLLDCYPQIAVVAHDAGGAEIVSGYIKRNNLHEKCRYSLKGPAIEIFRNKLDPINNENITKILAQCDCLFSATSWDSTHEFEAIRKAKELGIKTIAFLDHWVNYGQRFIRRGDEVLPEDIWVSDEYGFEIAKNIFGEKIHSIQIVENPYLAEANFMLEEAEKKIALSKEIVTSNNALFLSEAISEHAMKVYGNERYWGYTQLEAFQYFIENIDALGIKIKKIRIRPHPAESVEKFLGVLEKYQFRIEISFSSTLWEDIAWSKIVVGCSSMGMVASLASKRRVVCVIPPQGGLCKLPQTEIELLTKIIEQGKGKNV